MAGIDYYRDLNMDISIGLNYPSGMSVVFTSMKDLLISKGKYIVDEYNPMTVDAARSIAGSLITDHTSYHVVESNDQKVWDILRTPINNDTVRVLGLFHGKLPDNLPENMLIIDIGRSLHNQVPKAAVSSITESLSKKGKYPTGKTEDIFNGLLTLCYEVLFSPQYAIFSKKVAKSVPLASAFDFMYHPPAVLTDKSMKNAINGFVEDIHGWME